MGKPLKDETGSRYGRWVVTGRAPNKRSSAAWHCRCDCGNTSIVVGSSLRAGSSTKCRECNAPTRETHGMSKTPEYEVWTSIINRTENCKNNAFHNYGGRGIKMSPEWRASFESFYQDMGPRPSPKHTIERVDNSGPYSSENCRWALRAEQARNRRNNIVVEYLGETKCLHDWAAELGISPQTLYHRYKAGLTSPELLFSRKSLLWTRKPKGWKNKT